MVENIDIVGVRELSILERFRCLTTTNVSIDDISWVVIEMEKMTKSKLHGEITLEFVDGELIQIDTKTKQRKRMKGLISGN